MLVFAACQRLLRDFSNTESLVRSTGAEWQRAIEGESQLPAKSSNCLKMLKLGTPACPSNVAAENPKVPSGIADKGKAQWISLRQL